jgi:gamma-glutamylcysteine synthetase
VFPFGWLLVQQFDVVIELGETITALCCSSCSAIKVEMDGELEIGFIPVETTFGVSQFLLAVLDRASQILEGDGYIALTESTSGAKFQKGAH